MRKPLLKTVSMLVLSLSIGIFADYDELESTQETHTLSQTDDQPALTYTEQDIKNFEDQFERALEKSDEAPLAQIETPVQQPSPAQETTIVPAVENTAATPSPSSHETQTAPTQYVKEQAVQETTVAPKVNHTPPQVDNPNKNLNISPWESFLINTIGGLRFVQLKIQEYFSIVFSRQGIPMLIILFGIMLLSVVVWFAYVSFKKEQQEKIRNLVNNRHADSHGTGSKPLPVAYAEESSGDFDVFATNEGIPIKLDLAQAYINMQDIEGAKLVLQDIISQHRGKIVTAAQDMLKKIS